MKKITIIALTAIFPLLSTTAQNVGIGTASPNASAKLDIVDANRGILLPRVALTATNVQAPVTSPANWLVVFNTNVSAPGPFAVTEGLYYWDGTLLRWVRIGSTATASNDWTILGNAGTVATTNFVGTTDAVDFVTRTNNTERMRVTSAGNVGVGTTTPATSLSVNGATTIGTTYAGTLANAAPTNGLRVQGQTVINKPNGQDSRDIFSAHTSATAFGSVTGYASVTASRAVSGYADANGMGIFGYANRGGYGVVGLTQSGILSNFIQGGEGVLGQADGATGATGIPISVHGILDESVAGMRAATPVLGENNNITRGNGFTGGAYATVTAQSVAGVYGNIGSRGALAGDNGYMFGVIGDILVVSGTIPDGSGGVLGSSGSGSFGMLGYKGLTSTVYSVYGGGFAGSTAAGNTGNFTGGSSNNQNNAPNNHIGLGINGGFMGGYVKGNQYGMVSSGQEFGMYVQGKTIVNQPIVQLTTNAQGTDRIVSYAPTSTQVDVMTKGSSALVNGEIFVAFDDNFRKLINHNEPVIINITPRAETHGVYVSQVTAQGFYVRENMQGTSNAPFYWSATGTKAGFESGVTVSNTILNNNFDNNLGGVMMGEGEASANGTEPAPIYFDGQNVLFQRMPERLFINQMKVNPNGSTTSPNGNSGNNNTH